LLLNILGVILAGVGLASPFALLAFINTPGTPSGVLEAGVRKIVMLFLTSVIVLWVVELLKSKLTTKGDGASRRLKG